MVTLDIGCGTFPRGDINIDLAKNVSADIIADAKYLPFKDNCFRKVSSIHTIEHTLNPFKMLQEMIRVSNNRVFIQCPHRYSRTAKAKDHLSFLNITWFDTALNSLDVKHYRIIPTYATLRLVIVDIPLIWIDKIKVYIRKNTPGEMFG